MNYNILIAGVGGQGIVLTSRILALAAINAGFFARTAETIGMAQRGGSVVSHVRIGSEDVNPIIPSGKADLIIGFEPSEALRNIDKLHKDGKCIVNTHEIKPVTASLGMCEYNYNEILDYYKNNNIDTYFVDAYNITNSLEALKALNIFLLGYVSALKLLPISKDQLMDTIISIIPNKYQELNKMAFEKGFSEGIKK